jgi:hypothetical protein
MVNVRLRAKRAFSLQEKLSQASRGGDASK